MEFNPFGDDLIGKFFGILFGAVVLIAALGSLGSSSANLSEMYIDMGNNLIVLPEFFQGLAHREIDNVYVNYPVTFGGFANCIELEQNPYFHENFPEYYEINEITGDAVDIEPSKHIHLSAYLYAETNVTNDNYLYRGARLTIDFYGAAGRICEIGLLNGQRTYLTSQTLIQSQTVAVRGSGAWKYVEYDFSVPTTYLADPWGAYETNEAVTPTYFNVIVVNGCSPDYQEAETGRVWIRSIDLRVSN